MSDEQEAGTLVHRAIESARRGDIVDARTLLASALHQDAEYEPAWLWFAKISDDPGEQRYCLGRAYEISPGADTKAALDRLRGTEASIPPEIGDLEPPPRPDLVDESVLATRKRRNRNVVMATLLALVLVAGLVAVVGHLRTPAPVTIAVVLDRTASAGTVPATEVQRGIELAVARANNAEEIRGRRIDIRTYDDKGDPATARKIARQIVADDQILAVIGHDLSSTSLAAAPIYRDGGIPAITPTSNNDAVPASSDWYFQAVFGDQEQGRYLATYASQVLKSKAVSLVYDGSAYARALHGAADEALGELNPEAASETNHLELRKDHLAEDIRTIVGKLRTSRDPLILAADPSDPDLSIRVIRQLRSAGFRAPIVGGDAMGSEKFFRQLAAEDPALTRNVYASTGLLLDSMTGTALDWLRAYEKRTGTKPTWRGAAAYDATALVAHALQSEDLRPGGDVAHDRKAVRDALAATDDLSKAVQGATGPLYFDATGSVERALSMGRGDRGRLVSAPIQLVPYTPSAGVDPDEELKAGRAVRLGDELMLHQQVVQTGINIVEIRDFDSHGGTYSVDFYLWLKYVGDEKATDVVLVNAESPNTALGDPIESKRIGGLEYRLFRVKETFKDTFEFEDFPFDRQKLPVVVQNRTLPTTRVMYVGDRAVYDQSRAERLFSGVDEHSKIDDKLPDWQALDVRYFQNAVGNSSNVGDPAVAENGAVYVSQFVAETALGRYVLPFLVKNLLPLVLLMIATYVSLFFPLDQTATRVSFGVTGILSSAVMLNSVTSVLPAVSYTVAIEWAYYAFIIMSAGCIMVAMIGDRLVKRKRRTASARLALISQIAYPAVLLGVTLAYFFAYR